MYDGDTPNEEYIQLFNEIIEQQSIILGPDIATIIAKKVQGVIFSDKKVTGFESDPQQLLHTLINEYVNLSGMIVRKTIEPLLAKHPKAAASVKDLENQVAGQQTAAGIKNKGADQNTAASETLAKEEV